MKNTLGDLNNHLFEQLERLNDEELSDEQLEKEINRSTAINNVAKQIISNGNLVLRAMKQQHEIHGRDATEFPKMLEGNK